MTKAELERQRYQYQRQTILKELQEHIREKPEAGESEEAFK